MKQCDPANTVARSSPARAPTLVREISRPRASARANTRAEARTRAHPYARAKPRWRPNPKYAAVLRRLETSPLVRPACQVVGCSTGAFYRDMQLHPDFREKVEEARALGYERVEAEAYRRAMEGDEEYVVSGGKVVMIACDDQGDPLPQPRPLKRRRRSDRMLELILKGNLRDKYGTTRAEVSGLVAPSTSTDPPEPQWDLSRLKDDELKTLIALQHKACGLEVPA